jgi:hypothetical protein
MSFFGFDTNLPGTADRERFAEGPGLGDFEFLDDFAVGHKDEGEIQDFLESEQEADAANADTFGEIGAASGRQDPLKGVATIGSCRRVLR